MKGDFTRNTFQREKHYSGVRMQQGRVQLDADWNEQIDIQTYRGRTVYQDVIGLSGGPKGQDELGNDLAGFKIVVDESDNLRISAGRYYVDGILCENEAEGPIIPQPHFTAESLAEILWSPEEAAELTAGTYLAYLDVWERHITALEDGSIREIALGGPDTATRTQVIWQVRLLPLEVESGETADCDDFGPDWAPPGSAGTGKLSARAEPDEEGSGACIIPADAGYRRLENQLYRVEIHDDGGLGGATYKWSRENGSIAVKWLEQSGDLTLLTVSSVGRDKVLGFSTGDWAELTSDTHELKGLPGTLVQVVKATGNEITIDTATATGTLALSDFSDNPKIRRWEGRGDVENSAWLALEEGVEIHFEDGEFQTGDYWLVPARAMIKEQGGVLWPLDDGGLSAFQDRQGIYHHFCPLAVADFDGEAWVVTRDCRDLFPSLTGICAEDICFDNEDCDLVEAETVQDALDRLCAANDLRHHNKHLHGWGIVCGLQVVCGPDESEERRRNVTVREGYAITCEGDDLHIVEEEGRPGRVVDVLEGIDILNEVDPNNPVLDENGDGEVCLKLELNEQRQVSIGFERYDPNEKNNLQSLLAGTLLMDFYNNCIKSIQDFLTDQLTPPPEEEGRPVSPAQKRITALTNLLTQPVNPDAGQHIFISPREHEILVEFYEKLRAILQSETFCAMFDNARDFPQYPFEDLGMRTIFGKGQHVRLRLRPGAAEAYTVGPGLNPQKPSTLINRYDLRENVLVSQIDPLAGIEVGDGDKGDSGTGAIQDVAFSPDGRRIYVVIPTKNDSNTFFRSGQFGNDGSINWNEVVTICDYKLVTLATTAASPESVYAIGMQKITISEEDGSQRTELRGAGLFRINPDAVDANMEPEVEFNAYGHLEISPEGRAVATAAPEDAEPISYRHLIGMRLPQAATTFQVNLETSGRDDIAIVRLPGSGGQRREVVCTVVGPVDGEKRIFAHNLNNGSLRFEVPVSVPNDTIHLAAMPATNALLMSMEDGYSLRMVDTRQGSLPADYLLPMQVGPTAIAADEETNSVYVLNYLSNTITVVSGPELLEPTFTFPLERLAEYRKGVLEAFTDLLAGFLQYLKDCLCDHFLVNCPECFGDETIYLACVSIRQNEVYKTCNFSKRRYVKSFPTIGYWLSLLPITPFLDRMFEEFCCAVLPDLFSRFTVREYDEERSRSPQPSVRVDSMRSGITTIQGLDIMGSLNEFLNKGNIIGNVASDTLVRQPRSAFTRRPDQSLRTANIVGQSAERTATRLEERGIEVERKPYDPVREPNLINKITGFLRTPAPGSSVTLYEENDRVRYYTVADVDQTKELNKRVTVLSESLQSKDEELQALRKEVSELESLRAEVSELEALRTEVSELESLRGEVSGLEAELKELRSFRTEVQAFMKDRNK